MNGFEINASKSQRFFSLSPSGGEGWGEGEGRTEFCVRLALRPPQPNPREATPSPPWNGGECRGEEVRNFAAPSPHASPHSPSSESRLQAAGRSMLSGRSAQRHERRRVPPAEAGTPNAVLGRKVRDVAASSKRPSPQPSPRSCLAERGGSVFVGRVADGIRLRWPGCGLVSCASSRSVVRTPPPHPGPLPRWGRGDLISELRMRCLANSHAGTGLLPNTLKRGHRTHRSPLGGGLDSIA